MIKDLLECLDISFRKILFFLVPAIFSTNKQRSQCLRPWNLRKVQIDMRYGWVQVCLVFVAYKSILTVSLMRKQDPIVLERFARLILILKFCKGQEMGMRGWRGCRKDGRWGWGGDEGVERGRRRRRRGNRKKTSWGGWMDARPRR